MASSRSDDVATVLTIYGSGRDNKLSCQALVTALDIGFGHQLMSKVVQHNPKMQMNIKHLM